MARLGTCMEGVRFWDAVMMEGLRGSTRVMEWTIFMGTWIVGGWRGRRSHTAGWISGANTQTGSPNPSHQSRVSEWHTLTYTHLLPPLLEHLPLFKHTHSVVQQTNQAEKYTFSNSAQKLHKIHSEMKLTRVLCKNAMKVAKILYLKCEGNE